MHDRRVLWSGLPWLLSAALAVAVSWQGVELRQARQENERLRRREQQTLEAVEQLRRSDEEAAELARQMLEREQRQQGCPSTNKAGKEPASKKRKGKE